MMKPYLEELNNQIGKINNNLKQIENDEAGMKNIFEERKLRIWKDEPVDIEGYCKEVKIQRHFIITHAELAIDAITSVRSVLDLIEHELQPFKDYPDFAERWENKEDE